MVCGGVLVVVWWCMAVSGGAGGAGDYGDSCGGIGGGFGGI